MGLQSKLFKGNQKLEACLIHDSSHVTQGAVGDHVSKVQTALFALNFFADEWQLYFPGAKYRKTFVYNYRFLAQKCAM